MTALPGTRVTAPIVPTDSADVYPTHEARFGKGGWRAVANLAARNAIPADRRETGMQVYVEDQRRTFVLRGGVGNANWQEVAVSVPGRYALGDADATVPSTAPDDVVIVGDGTLEAPGNVTDRRVYTLAHDDVLPTRQRLVSNLSRGEVPLIAPAGYELPFGQALWLVSDGTKWVVRGLLFISAADIVTSGEMVAALSEKASAVNGTLVRPFVSGLRTKVVAATFASGALTFNLAGGAQLDHQVTLTANVTSTTLASPPTAVADELLTMRWVVKQDATGGRAFPQPSFVALAAGVTWAVASAPNASTVYTLRRLPMLDSAKWVCVSIEQTAAAPAVIQPDNSLPFRGLGIGPSGFGYGHDNERIETAMSFRFQAWQAKQVESFVAPFRAWTSGSSGTLESNGYHKGNGGNYRIDLREDDDGLPGALVAVSPTRTSVYRSDAGMAWTGSGALGGDAWPEWQLYAPNASGAPDTGAPRPILDPMAFYHLVIEHPAGGASNCISLNLLASRLSNAIGSAGDFNPALPGWGVLVRSSAGGWSRLTTHFPLFHLKMTDGSFIGTQSMSGYIQLDAVGDTCFAQEFVPEQNCSVDSIRTGLWRATDNVTNNLRLEIKSGATVLQAVTIPASSVPYRAAVTGWESPAVRTPHVIGTFPAPAALLAGQTYRAVFRSLGAGTTYRGRWVYNNTRVGSGAAILRGRNGWGTNPVNRCVRSTDGGSSWATFSDGSYNSASGDAPLHLNFSSRG